MVQGILQGLRQKATSRRARGETQRRIRQDQQDLLDGDVLAQNTHRDAEAAKVSKLCFAASSSLCIMLTHSAIFNGCFELTAFSYSASERPHIALKISTFLFKRIVKQVGCDSTDPDQYSAWNLRQRLSPKAKPWDSDNPDQGKRQACHWTVLMALSRIEGLVGVTETGCHVDSKQRFSPILFIL